MIYYGTPYSVERCLGRAYNCFIRTLPEDQDFACLVDADAVFTTHDFGHQLHQIVVENPGCRLFYARTNRIACPWQRDACVPGDDMRQHREHGKDLAIRFGHSVHEVQTESVPGSGFLMLVRRDLGRQIPFKEQGILEVDWDFFRRVAKTGEKILLMEGVYLYHWYRGGNSGDVAHLR